MDSQANMSNASASAKENEIPSNLLHNVGDINGQAPEEIKIVLQSNQIRMREVGAENVKAMWKTPMRMLTVPSEASVEHICRFVITRMLVESNPPVVNKEFDVDNVEMYLKTGHGHEERDFELLPHKQSLADVYLQYWNIKRPLDMSFAIKGDLKLREKVQA